MVLTVSITISEYVEMFTVVFRYINNFVVVDQVVTHILERRPVLVSVGLSAN